MTIVARNYHEVDDLDRVRNLLIVTQQLNWTRHNWSLHQWESWRYLRDDLDSFPTEQIRLWETDSGELVAVAHSHDPGEIVIQIHPDYREIEPEVLAWAQAELATRAPIGNRVLQTWVYDYDDYRQMLLAQQRFRRQRRHRNHRWRSLRAPVEAPYIPEGYALREVRQTEAEDALIAELLSYCQEAPPSAAALANFRVSPNYQSHLHLVIEDEGGEVVSHCSALMNATSHDAQITPACTHPEHRLQGLATALLFELLRRLRTAGVQRAYVISGDGHQINNMYEKVGFRDFHREYLWYKEF
ncbi:MAG: GNAT family N-acetyltransferase [Anaerolineae bacterium]|nr:GNAT family N-acetyltransferase [Anaerolineae bacterium]